MARAGLGATKCAWSFKADSTSAVLCHRAKKKPPWLEEGVAQRLLVIGMTWGPLRSFPVTVAASRRMSRFFEQGLCAAYMSRGEVYATQVASLL